jgi:hypothetical protein
MIKHRRLAASAVLGDGWAHSGKVTAQRATDWPFSPSRRAALGTMAWPIGRRPSENITELFGQRAKKANDYWARARARAATFVNGSC